MSRRHASGAYSLAALVLTVAPLANAASLQPVSNWSVSGLPADVTMYAYVPDKVAQTPPILTLIHYCGGTASSVFGQAQGGGLVKAADQYGFIIVVPSSGRCWDIVSDKTRKRDGGGDSQAIRQMVKYAVEKYKANPDRVYATGDSSGGMMTELLLAVYPDVFKAGSAFAGMPAGCRGSNETGSGGGYSNACAGGSVSHTPQEWGDLARSLDPGFSGRRPRVQLFHGDADSTIKYPNFTEAIKEWTNVLSLGTSPTSTDSSLTLGMHQGKRQTWQGSCGFAELDAFTSIGGDHGPSDTLFVAQYVIPFLGLDKTGMVDPAQCNSGGAGGAGSGGASGNGGAANSGGTANASAGATSVAGSGGFMTSSGGNSVGGSAPVASGGAGNVTSGANTNGGARNAAGAQGLAGSSVATAGGAQVPPPNSDGSDSSGCSCNLASAHAASAGRGMFAILAAALALCLRRRRSNAA
ncbi:MAG TPA: PHB depolymerase family esterase [Polyangiaceae bacterium]|nr:PHB depolymerase family esterase [Polyangiaceae bacterium]